MNKYIEITTDSSYGTTFLLPGLPVSARWDCNVLQTLLYVGYLTSPPRYRGFDLTTYWAWLRYSAAISNTHRGLRLRPAWAELDAHQKTILSDDFGMGFPCHYLIEQHGFEDFADTNYLLSSVLAGVVSHAQKPKRGPAKSPDFIAIDALGQLHILECKGTQTRSYLDDALTNGLDQKGNLSNGTIFTSCMVGGLFIPQDSARAEAEVVFIDPEPNEDLKRLERIDPIVLGQAI